MSSGSGPAGPRLSTGDEAPAFELSDEHGVPVPLGEVLQERSVLLVFFPFAFSRICTGELDLLRREQDSYDRLGVQLLGVTCDAMYALRAWSDAQHCPFPLLSDFWPHGKLARAYGVFDEAAGMPVRGTFLIGRDGRVAWSLVNPPGQARDWPLVRREVTSRARDVT